jgi:hypothetical protein
MGQVFYYKQSPSEDDSVRFPVRKGVWEEIRVPMPPQGPQTHFRIDPPGTGGACVIASMRFEPRILLKEPVWPRPEAPRLQGETFTVRSGDVELIHNLKDLGGFAIKVSGRQMGTGFTHPLAGYMLAGRLHWLDLHKKAQVTVQQEESGAITVKATAMDEDGGRWRIQQRFEPEGSASALGVDVEITTDKDRSVVFMPMLIVLPGAGSFGEARNQGLFPGLEYLDAPDKSSSEADIIGPGSRRQVPDSAKITMPLMAIQAEDRYIALHWKQAPHFCAVFDSPDRLFKSGASVMGLLYPGSNGGNREEGSLLPYRGETLKANSPLRLHAVLLGGNGKSVIPAVKAAVSLSNLPELPKTQISLEQYVSLVAAGYLDSKIRAGSHYSHAYPGDFRPGPAGDVAVWEKWLARNSKDPVPAKRLEEASQAARRDVNPSDFYASGIGHIRTPVGALMFGDVKGNLERARQRGYGLLGRFQPDGSIPYVKSSGSLDYGRTHFAPDANGLTAQVVSTVLESAAFTGDRKLVEEGIRRLRALDKFANTAPRGAQTWEVPLHTPDILASAYLVRAYTLGYELTGEKLFLDQAIYWAWTGVPFVYLVNPTDQPVGPYSTIAVFGATQWKAPNWMGMPVQWCGLVYSDALYRLVRHDRTGPWLQIAKGITLSGIQQTWPIGVDTERQGLLPDSFSLRAQTRNDAAINPGTLLANAARLDYGPAPYDFRSALKSGLFIHAPGDIVNLTDEAGKVRFTVKGWPTTEYTVLVTGLQSRPRLLIDGKEAPLSGGNEWLEKEGALAAKVKGSATIEVILTR